MTEAQRERAREARKIEAQERRDKEKRAAIEARKKKMADIRAASADTDEPIEDFGMEGVFDDSGQNVPAVWQPQIPTLPAFERIPLKGELVEGKGTPVSLTAGQRDVFLRQFSTWGNAGSAAWDAGTSISTIKALREYDPLFDVQFEEAREVFKASIDNAVIRRGRDGWREPVFSTTMGHVIGYKRVYDSALLQMAAKRLLPEKFGDNIKVDHEVKGVLVLRSEKRMTEEEWAHEYADQGAEILPPSSDGQS